MKFVGTDAAFDHLRAWLANEPWRQRWNAVTVLEKLGSLSCKQWDRVAARVIAVSGRSYLTGALIRFEFDAADRLVARLVPEKEIAFIPGQGPPLFTQGWLEYWIEQFEHPLRATNVDGDDLAFVEMRFPVGDDAAAAIAAHLDAAADLERRVPEETQWSWYAPCTAPPASAPAPAPGRVVSAASMDPEGRQIRGTIRLAAGALFLETNSVRRSEAD